MRIGIRDAAESTRRLLRQTKALLDPASPHPLDADAMAIVSALVVVSENALLAFDTIASIEREPARPIFGFDGRHHRAIDSGHITNHVMNLARRLRPVPPLKITSSSST